MALKGLRVVEMAGLAPAPFCGMVLSDFGASVIRVDKVDGEPVRNQSTRNKRSVSVNLKTVAGVNIVKALSSKADVLIEPYRPGVMEKLGLGPKVLLEENPRLVYARLTGFGQYGSLAPRAGHDINYLAISGVLSRLGRANDKPMFPVNLLADFAGGGLTCALGIVMALLERSRSGQGQVIDSNMVEGAAYVSSFLFNSRDVPIWNEKRGTGWLDGGKHFYDTYETQDGGYMSVGAIEPQFYAQLLEGLGLDPNDCPQFGDDTMKQKLTDVFLTKTRDEWSAVFDDTDACVMPVLSMDEAAAHPHNTERRAFFTDTAHPEPKPAPNLSRTPAINDASGERPIIGQHTNVILQELGYSKEDIDRLNSERVVKQTAPKHKL